jgi:flagellar L-ring protein precursor FlgH
MNQSMLKCYQYITPLFLLVLGGCAATHDPLDMDDPAYAPHYPVARTPPPPTQGSLFSQAAYNGLFNDPLASRVGDILTIRLSETTTSSKSASTTYNKSTDASMTEPVILGSLVRGLEINGGNLNSINSDNDFAGTSSSDQNNSLRGNISVTIAEVLPTGSYVVRGEKWMKLNQGDEYIRISGIVRGVDIDATNGIDSNKLANARITYGGKGAGANANEAGWLARFFINPFFPY